MSMTNETSLGDTLLEPIKDTDALSKAILAVVNWAVKCGTENTTSGNYIMSHDDFKHLIAGSDFRKYLNLIVIELSGREEVLDVEADLKRGKLDCIFGLNFCPSYEWTEGDEATFGCSYEDWLDMPIAPISQPDTLQTLKFKEKE